MKYWLALEWCMMVPDRENTENLVNLILTQGKLSQYRENCVHVVESLTCNVIVESKGGKNGCKGWWGKFIFKKKTICYLCTEKHREIGREFRENTEFNLYPNYSN